MSLVGVLGLLIWLAIVLLAGGALWLVSQPGHRRMRIDKNYSGPERRANPNKVDFLANPMLTSPKRTKPERARREVELED